ncbi:hypothetical protein ACN38_g10886 [Penicillium nordicum]|uniref:Uncharacterized protein n=1 Tax=Penicillium nordicum TaxID=229535 RepID=A0A0M9WBF6_9EURO|nr:hypothetical protein ACN38_g10886 [Penicillium nordicum]
MFMFHFIPFANVKLSKYSTCLQHIRPSPVPSGSIYFHISAPLKTRKLRYSSWYHKRVLNPAKIRLTLQISPPYVVLSPCLVLQRPVRS